MPYRLAVFWIVVSLQVASGVPLPADDSPSRETWQVIALRGQRIGYGHVVESRTERNGRPIVVTRFRMHTVMKRFDGKVSIIIDQRVEEDLDGNLLSFQFELSNPPVAMQEIRVVVSGGELRMTTISGGQTTNTQLAVPVDLKSPHYPDRRIEESPPPPDSPAEMRLFDPQVGAVLSIRLSNRGPAEFTVPGGQPQPGRRFTVEYLDGIPGLRVEGYTDRAGRLVYNEAPLLGTTTWNVTREVALADLPADVDIGLAALLPLKQKIEHPERLRTAVYRLQAEAGLADDLIPASELQTVERIDTRTLQVRVGVLPPGAAVPPASGEPAPGAEYLASTALARSDDPEVANLAARAAAADAAPVAIAIGAERTVHRWLNRKNMSTNLASASEVVRSRSGDCTEHAVLLTALLRARQVPARVVVGVVYWDQYSAFAGHAWTEAWLEGRWVALDATQARAGCSADRIRLAHSSLAEGDAGLIAGVVATWRLLDTAAVEIVALEYDPEGAGR